MYALLLLQNDTALLKLLNFNAQDLYIYHSMNSILFHGNMLILLLTEKYMKNFFDCYIVIPNFFRNRYEKMRFACMYVCVKFNAWFWSIKIL